MRRGPAIPTSSISLRACIVRARSRSPMARRCIWRAAPWSKGACAKGKNITIRGRGVLGGEESPRFQGPGRYLLDCQDCQDLTVRNCFFRTQDDSIAVKGLAKLPRPCENILIEDCEFWTDVANIFRIGYECETAGMRNIRARNIDVLHYSKNYREPTNYWANAIIWLQPNQNMVMEDCHFEKRQSQPPKNPSSIQIGLYPCSVT